MTSIPELGATLNIPIQDVVRMGETQVRNPDSMIYKNIKAEAMRKLAAMRSDSAVETKKRGGKQRVYIQHHVESNYRYSLVSTYPQFDIKWSSVDIRSGAVLIAASTLVGEYMLSKLHMKQGRVVALGLSLKQVILRNRDWIHLCVPGHVARIQAEFWRDDRSTCAITHATAAAGKNTGLAGKYVAAQSDVHCTSATFCEFKAKVAVVVLDRVDTNFRQLAVTMRQHGSKLMFFAVPFCKQMELGIEGKFHDLDAYVFPSDGGERINISYKNAPALDMSYRYSNYLELIARTSVVLDGKTYHKEFDSYMHGFAVYKITCLDAQFSEAPPPYKSWCEPGYDGKYLAYLPVLRDGGSVGRAQDWTLVGYPVDRTIVDDVIDFAMRAQGMDMVSRRIEQRLFTRTSNYVLVDQVVSDDGKIPIQIFDQLCLALYCGIFMRKFMDGKAVATLAPHARQIAKLSNTTALSVTQAYVGMVLGNLVRATSIVTDSVREAYYSTVSEADLPTPTFAICPGFVEYSDNGSSNPRFRGWDVPEHQMNYGFTTSMPGVSKSELIDGFRTVRDDVSVSVDNDTVAQLIASGEAYLNVDGNLGFTNSADVLQLACGLFTSVKSLFNDNFDVETVASEADYVGTAMQVRPHDSGVAVPHGGLYSEVPRKQYAVTDTPLVKSLASRIVEDTGGLVSVTKERLTENKLEFTPCLPEIVPGHYADDAKEYLRDAIMKIFPNSMVMDTSQFETDRSYSGWETVAKAIKAKIDVSKISGVKPESFYRPLLHGHVHPHAKNNFTMTFQAARKRNMDTPTLEEEMDIDFLWARSWDASLRVFYVPGAAQKLADMPYIGPSDVAVEEWVSRLDDTKKAKLQNADGTYSLADLVSGATDTQMIVKGKLKPALDASYDTAVKYPQTIQYDGTGKSVAVFSPIIGQKVAREQSILKPNVLVLQGKSVDDVNRFVNNFDWREDSRGKRRYIEIDYSQYDKSQGRRLAEMYLRRLSVFGVLPEFVRFIRNNQHVRTLAAMKAGFKIWLRDQNMSGAAFTLDRNNDINEMVIAELLDKIREQIEFIILMGDDILIAVRGDVDVSEWEGDLSRKFNLTLKAGIHEHGYICSMDIVHLPNGHSRVVADVVKRALAFMDQSVKDEDKFKEKFVSYADGMRGIEDLHTQVYLSAALPERMKSYLPGTTSDAIMSLCKAHARLKSDYSQYRAMFSDTTQVRTY